MKYKNIFLLVFILFIPFGSLKVNAQNTDSEPKQILKHSVGAAAGFTTGYGLSYRYRPGKFGVQGTFAPYSNGNVKTFSTGVTFLYTILENSSSNLYIYQGNHYFYHSFIGSTYEANGIYTTKRYTDSYMNNGLGVGIELIIAKRVGLNLMGGYAAYENFSGLNLTGEVAMYYKF